MSYKELLEQLKAEKRITIPQTLVGQFRNYAEQYGICVQGGGIWPNGMRLLYID